MKLHGYLSNKEFTTLNISPVFPRVISLTPAEYSLVGRDGRRGWVREEVKILLEESQRIIRYKLPMLSREELMGSSCNEQSSYLPWGKIAEIVKSCEYID